jgi:NAD-dependent aldehyde dehydrogenases
MAVGDGSQAAVDMGPVVTSDHCKKILGYIETGVAEGASRFATAAM